jgi:hypothetical protein
MGNRHPILYNKSMKNIFLTNAAARRDPAVIAAMAAILERFDRTGSYDLPNPYNCQPHTVEVSPVNFLQDVMDDLGDPRF